MTADTEVKPLLIDLPAELRSDLVVLRPYADSDALDLHKAVDESREHIRPWLPFAGEHRSPDESLEWIRRQSTRWITRESMNWTISSASDGRFLGGIGLIAREWKIPYFEIGYWLRASAEGHGYITEATRLITRFALDELHAKRVEIKCDERNTRSAAVPRRLGYTQEGLMRNEFLDPLGNVRNTLVFSMVPDSAGASKE